MLLAAARRSCSRALALPGPPPVPVLPPWLPSVAPGSHGGGGPRVGFRGARSRGLLPVPARPGGLGKFLRRSSPSFLGRCAGGLPRGVAVTRCGAAVQLLRHIGASEPPGNTGNNSPESSQNLGVCGSSPLLLTDYDG